MNFPNFPLFLFLFNAISCVWYTGILTIQNRGLSGLEPAVPTLAPYLDAPQSTSSLVQVAWGHSSVSGIPDAVIAYNVSYTLNSGPLVTKTVSMSDAM